VPEGTCYCCAFYHGHRGRLILTAGNQCPPPLTCYRERCWRCSQGALRADCLIDRRVRPMPTQHWYFWPGYPKAPRGGAAQRLPLLV
jgi:hypothetical protein